MKLLGAVLAGGGSRRFGSDKAVARLAGRTLIDHVIAALGAQTDAIVICGRDLAGFDCLVDCPAPDLGPLGGLNAALHHAAAHGFDAVLSAPCDAPLLPADLAARLIAAGPVAIVPHTPVIGLWPVALAPTLALHLAHSDDRAVRRWADLVGAAAADVAPLGNVNTPADLAALSVLPRASPR